MTLKIRDRVRDTSTTTGTGAITVTGTAPATYQSFGSAFSIGDTFYGCISAFSVANGGSGNNEWEVGYYTYSSANTITRTTVLAGSNGTSAVNFSAGLKDVFAVMPARAGVYQEKDGYVTIWDRSVSAGGEGFPLTAFSTAGFLTIVMENGGTYNQVFAGAGIQPFIASYMTRASTIGAQGALLLNDVIQGWDFSGSDGTTNNGFGAAWHVKADGNWAAGDTPGRIDFYTTPVGSETAVERLRITSSGAIVAGDFPELVLDSLNNHYQSISSSALWDYSLIRYGASATAPSIGFAKTRGSVPTTQTAVVSSDQLGSMIFYGSDGTNFIPSALIQALVTGSVSTGVVPTSVLFYTGSNSYGLERLRIASDGTVVAGGFASQSLDSTIGGFQSISDGSTWHYSGIKYGNNVGGVGLGFAKTRGATPTTQAAVSQNDQLFAFLFYGSDGTNFIPTGYFEAVVTGAVSTGVVPTSFAFATGSSGYGLDRLRIDPNGNVIVNTAAIATNATDGFLYIPTTTGPPTGTPTSYSGTVPIIYDTTNHKLYIYDGSWRGGTAPGAWS